MVKKKNTAIRPYEDLAKLYEKYGGMIDNAIIFLIQGFLFVITIIVIFAVLLATGLFVF